jgi:hypothetical protein
MVSIKSGCMRFDATCIASLLALRARKPKRFSRQAPHLRPEKRTRAYSQSPRVAENLNGLKGAINGIGPSLRNTRARLMKGASRELSAFSRFNRDH